MGSRLAVRHLQDGLLLTETEAWALYVIPPVRYAFLSEPQRVSVRDRASDGLAALRQGEFWQRTVRPPFDLEGWRDGFPAAPGRAQDTVEFLDGAGGADKWTLLGVRLDSREHPYTRAVNAARRRTIARRLPEWTEQADRLLRSVGSGPLRARQATAKEIEYVFRRASAPGVPDVRTSVGERKGGVWRRESLAWLSDVETEERSRTLRVGTEQGSGWVAHLVVALMPEDYDFPALDPWGYYADKLDWPVSLSIRGVLRPAHEARADLRKRVRQAVEQAEHIRQADHPVPPTLQDQVDIGEDADRELARDPQPLVYGRAVLSVEGATEEEVRQRASDTIEHYRDLGITLAWPAAEQYRLWRSTLPGERLTLADYEQFWQCDTLAEALPWAASRLGDGVGPLIGVTSGRSRTPVFWDPHHAPMRMNRPGGALFISPPGSGKTQNAVVSVVNSVLMYDAAAVIVDPSGETQEVRRHPELAGRVEVIDVLSSPDGAWDPFLTISLPRDADAALAAIMSQKALTRETIRRLLRPGSLTDDKRYAILRAVDLESRDPAPSLAGVIDRLKADRTKVAQQVGWELAEMDGVPLARLLLRRPVRRVPRTAHADLTILTLTGMVPRRWDAPQDESTEEQQVTDALLNMVSVQARDMIFRLPKDVRKILMLDEARNLTGTTLGHQLADDAGFNGRKRNLALLICAHLVQHVAGLQGAFSMVSAFRNQSVEQQPQVCDWLGVDPMYGPGLADLGDGEAFIRDVSGGVDRVQFVTPDRVLAGLLETAPTGLHVAA